MTKTAILTNIFSSAPARRVSSVRYSAETNPLVTWMSYGLVALNALVLLAYVFGVNSYASQGYEMKKVQTRINVLAEENKKLTLKISEQTSIAALEAEIANSTFVPVDRMVYVRETQLTKK
jgi:hypothetical protein